MDNSAGASPISANLTHPFSPWCIAQCPDLPPEILSTIFLRAIPPDFLLPLSPACQRQDILSYAIQTKLSISAVSKFWNLVATPLLYHDVVFRRFEQIPMFLRTIMTAPDYRNFVKEVIVHCFIPPQNDFDSSFKKYMKDIFDICPSIKGFSILPPLFFGSVVNILPLQHRITQLSLNIVTPDFLQLIRHTHETLITLTVFLQDVPLRFLDANSFLFPNLEDLRIFIETSSEDFCNVERDLQPLIEVLHTPRLRRFAFTCIMGPQRYLQTILSFLQKHGPGLRSLHLHSRYTWKKEYLRPFLAMCPMLEHLAVHPHNSSGVAHPTLCWLDVGKPYYRRYLDENHLYKTCIEAKTAFPALKGLREIDSRSVQFISISTSLSPDLVASDDEAFDFTFQLQYRPRSVHVESFISKHHYICE